MRSEFGVAGIGEAFDAVEKRLHVCTECRRRRSSTFDLIIGPHCRGPFAEGFIGKRHLLYKEREQRRHDAAGRSLSERIPKRVGHMDDRLVNGHHAPEPSAGRGESMKPEQDILAVFGI